MRYKEALEYINTAKWYGSKPGLERISALLEAFGNPQNELKFVHIAGTNGKGSCAAMTASVFKSAGYKTGLYISPYINRFNERMQINGKDIEDDELTDLVARIKPVADAMEEHPTVFEIVTAAALLWFKEKRCDIVVLEVGLGGRLDATNVIGCPEAAVIMNIGLDHTEVLGSTLPEIAAEKAGIIKEGTDCILYQQTKEVEDVVAKACEEKHAKLHVADFSKIEKEFDSLYGQTFSYKGEAYAIPLLGENQLKNAAVVIELGKVLREKGWDIPQEDLEHGIYAVHWPARFEIVKEEPFFVLDGGHNPQCARTIADNLENYFPKNRHIVLIGILADKDYENFCKIINLAADEYVCVTPNSERALPAEKLAEYLKRFKKPVQCFDNIKDGITAAMDRVAQDGMVCAAGSLYMAGDIRAIFGLN